MKPRRTHFTNRIFRLPGGNEDNDLWTYNMNTGDGNVICSVWEPTPEERERIAAGQNIRLNIWGTRMPPVLLDLTDEPLGKAP